MPKQDPVELIPLDETVLVRISPGSANLPLDTSIEWQKGFLLINKILALMMQESYKEAFQSKDGETHERTIFHPQLLPFFQERRKLMDQIWKISGGEAENEGRKELAKNMAKMVFELGKDPTMKLKYEEDVKKIIEAEYHDDVKENKHKDP